VSVKIIDVFLNMSDTKISIGRLAESEGRIYFEYDQAFLNSGIELSPYKLPLKPGVQVCDDRVFEGLFGLFADSLPDGWGRLLLDRHLLKLGKQYEKITPLDRLGYIGNYGMGALSYEPVIEQIAQGVDTLILDELAESSLQILKGSEEEMPEKMIETLLSLGGSSAGKICDNRLGKLPTNVFGGIYLGGAADFSQYHNGIGLWIALKPPQGLYHRHTNNWVTAQSYCGRYAKAAVADER